MRRYCFGCASSSRKLSYKSLLPEFFGFGVGGLACFGRYIVFADTVPNGRQISIVYSSDTVSVLYQDDEILTSLARPGGERSMDMLLVKTEVLPSRSLALDFTTAASRSRCGTDC